MFFYELFVVSTLPLTGRRTATGTWEQEGVTSCICC